MPIRLSCAGQEAEISGDDETDLEVSTCKEEMVPGKVPTRDALIVRILAI